MESQGEFQADTCIWRPGRTELLLGNISWVQVLSNPVQVPPCLLWVHLMIWGVLAHSFLIISPFSNWKIPPCHLLEQETLVERAGSGRNIWWGLVPTWTPGSKLHMLSNYNQKTRGKLVDCSPWRTFPCLVAVLRPGWQKKICPSFTF